jgi:hypothetical protein
MTAGKRIFDDDYFGGSRVSFDGWDGLNDYEKLAAKVFEEGIENTLKIFPPHVNLAPNEDHDDLIITCTAYGLGNGEDGPTWQFSVKENLARLDDMGHEDKTAFLTTLLALAQIVRAKLSGLEGEQL